MSEALACEVGVPGVLKGVRAGWYLVAANQRVEAGPFPDEDAAMAAAAWMDDESRGINPAPWHPIYSRNGLQVGSRWRPSPRGRQLTV